MTTLRFYTDSDGIKRSLKQMFAGTSSLIREVAQNAQRAQATGFWIDADESKHELRLRNNGKIMKELDWQRLFGVGVSAWDEKTTSEQNPFGIGCTSMLMVANTVTIHSGYTRAAISCAAFRDGTEIQTESVPGLMSGAEFTLTFDSDTWEKLGLTRLHITFAGFGIPVYFNGQEIDRPLDSQHPDRITVPFEYGHISLPRRLPLLADSFKQARGWSTQLFAQGLPIEMFFDTAERFNSGPKAVFAVHLDTTKITPSAPDRTRLVDAPDNLPEIIVKATKGAVSYLLNREADSASWFEVTRRYPKMISYAAPDVWAREDACVFYDNIGTLADDYVRVMGSFSELDWGSAPLFSEVDALPANAIPQGLLIYDEEVEINPLRNELAFYNFASALELPIIIASHAPHNHAVLSRGFTGADGEEFGAWAVEAANASEPKSVNHPELVLNFDVVFFDSLTVTPPPITLENGATVQWPTGTFNDAQYFAVNGTLYMGRNCHSVFDFVGQMDSFPVDAEDDFYDRDHDAQDEAHCSLMRVLKGLRGESLESLLMQSIRDQCTELAGIKDLLKGKRFTLAIDDLGALSIEEVAA